MKKKWFRTTDLVSEEYLAEADPARDRTPNLRKRILVSTLAACACLALVLGSLWLLKPDPKSNPPRIDNYTQGSSHSDVTTKPDLPQDTTPPQSLVPLKPKPADDDYTAVIELLSALKLENDYLDGMRPGAGSDDFLVDEVAPPTSAPTTKPDATPDKAPDTGMNSGTGAESEGYVEVTDNQTAGVIEADRIKRTDKHIFYLDGTKLRVFSIAGKDSKELDNIELYIYNSSASNWEFFLSADGKTVTVMAPGLFNNETNVISLDVSDPADIVEKNRIKVSGNYLSSRVTNGKILLMTEYVLNRYTMDFEDETTFLPQINGQSIPAGDIILPEQANIARYMVVLQMDESNLEIQGQAACLSYAQEAYVSQNHIFLSRNFTKVEEQEDKKKQNSMVEITCLSYGDTIEKKGTITLRGFLKDKWSMDEYEGILRVVTTTNTVTMVETEYGETISVRFENEQTNASLYCLDLTNFALVAKAEDFAPPGEDVKSVRFDKTAAYVCTAIQVTDPVFFFDLSDLNNITYKHTGNIDGFSTSLVNFGDGYLLGIGRENWDTFKVEIYREGENGVESICAYTKKYAYYCTEYKSYYIDRENQLLGLGINWDDPSTGKYHSGYLVLHFDGEELTEAVYVDLNGNLKLMRGVYVDGYMYMFGEDDFKVEKLFENATNLEITKITDRAAEENIPCDTAMEKFFEDADNEYYFGVMKSQYIKVIYTDGSSEPVVAALQAGRAAVADLDKFGIEYYIKAKGKPAASVFNTENISGITFYSYYGQGKGSVVPAENMTEIINWLDSIAIAREASDADVPPGTNTYQVEIEYADGTIIKKGLDVIVVGDTRYLLQKNAYPDCFAEIISKTSL